MRARDVHVAADTKGTKYPRAGAAQGLDATHGTHGWLLRFRVHALPTSDKLLYQKYPHKLVKTAAVVDFRRW